MQDKEVQSCNLLLVRHEETYNQKSKASPMELLVFCSESVKTNTLEKSIEMENRWPEPIRARENISRHSNAVRKRALVSEGRRIWIDIDYNTSYTSNEKIPNSLCRSHWTGEARTLRNKTSYWLEGEELADKQEVTLTRVICNTCNLKRVPRRHLALRCK